MKDKIEEAALYVLSETLSESKAKEASEAIASEAIASMDDLRAKLGEILDAIADPSSSNQTGKKAAKKKAAKKKAGPKTKAKAKEEDEEEDGGEAFDLESPSDDEFGLDLGED